MFTNITSTNIELVLFTPYYFSYHFFIILQIDKIEVGSSQNPNFSNVLYLGEIFIDYHIIFI